MKKCFKCQKEKEVNCFYKHPGMRDGHIGKCIDCAKIDASNRETRLKNDPLWIEKERERQRKKHKRLGYHEKYTLKRSKFIKDNGGYLPKNTRRILNVKDPNVECHHWSYLKEHRNDVFLLTRSDHKKLHKRMSLTEKMIFITNDGELLETRDSHHKFIKKILQL